MRKWVHLPSEEQEWQTDCLKRHSLRQRTGTRWIRKVSFSLAALSVAVTSHNWHSWYPPRCGNAKHKDRYHRETRWIFRSMCNTSNGSTVRNPPTRKPSRDCFAFVFLFFFYSTGLFPPLSIRFSKKKTLVYENPEVLWKVCREKLPGQLFIAFRNNQHLWASLARVFAVDARQPSGDWLLCCIFPKNLCLGGSKLRLYSLCFTVYSDWKVGQQNSLKLKALKHSCL